MTNERRFYTYAYLREDGTPYYIGKGQGNRAYRKSGRAIGMPPRDRIILLKTGLTEEEAFRHEIYMIAVFGRKDIGTGILYNFSDGGEGSSGRQWSEESREKARQSKVGNKHALGYRLSEEHKEKIRQAQLGMKHSEERKERNRLNQLGKKLSKEIREKISVANRGKRKPPRSLEHREKIRKSREGLLHWTDGCHNKMAKDCPGEGWVRGRTLSKSNSTK